MLAPPGGAEINYRGCWEAIHAYGSVESKKENLVSFPILDENLVDNIIKIMLVENIVAHILLLEATMAQGFPIYHTFLE